MGLISMKVKSIIKIIKIIIITNKETYLFPTALAADSDTLVDTLVETSAVVAPAASEDAGESYH
jgi:hypothetical protein